MSLFINPIPLFFPPSASNVFTTIIIYNKVLFFCGIGLLNSFSLSWFLSILCFYYVIIFWNSFLAKIYTFRYFVVRESTYSVVFICASYFTNHVVNIFFGWISSHVFVKYLKTKCFLIEKEEYLKEVCRFISSRCNSCHLKLRRTQRRIFWFRLL